MYLRLQVKTSDGSKNSYEWCLEEMQFVI